MYKLTIYPALEKEPKRKIEQEFQIKSDMDQAKALVIKLLGFMEQELKTTNAITEQMWCEDSECWSDFI